MILSRPDPAQVVLQVFSQNLDGTPKTSLATASVRVYHVDGVGAEIEDLGTTVLVQVGASNTWRYRWEPTSLVEGQYIVEYSLDDGVREWVGGEDLRVIDFADESTLTGIASDVELLKKIETGRWQIVNNQMIFYDTDDTTPILVFDLFDLQGNPAMDVVFERRKP